MVEPVTREAADALLMEIIEVCKRHGLWLSHEDAHGAFMVERASTEEWLRAALLPMGGDHG